MAVFTIPGNTIIHTDYKAMRKRDFPHQTINISNACKLHAPFFRQKKKKEKKAICCKSSLQKSTPYHN